MTLGRPLLPKYIPGCRSHGTFPVVGESRQPRPSSPSENRRRTPDEFPRRTGVINKQRVDRADIIVAIFDMRLGQAMPNDAFASHV